nr:hypothetical protein [Flavobacterium sp. ASV13]
MKTIYAPLDVRVIPNNDNIKGPLVRTIHPNYILLSIKIVGMAILTALYIKQLLWPNARIPDIKIDYSKPFQGIFLPLFVLAILLYFLAREAFFITRKIKLYYYVLEINALFYKKTYPYNEIKDIVKTFEKEKIHSHSNSGIYYYRKKYFYEIFLNNGNMIKLAKRDFYNLEKGMENLKQNLLPEK